MASAHNTASALPVPWEREGPPTQETPHVHVGTVYGVWPDSKRGSDSDAGKASGAAGMGGVFLQEVGPTLALAD